MAALTSARARPWVMGAALAALCLVVYGRILGHGFVNWDDQAQLYENRDFNPPTAAKIARYWREPHMQLYLPLTYSTWGAVASVAYRDEPVDGVHLRAAWFHGINLAAHVGAVLLVFALLRELTGQDLPAAGGAMVFAIHPLMTEPIAWASALYTVLSAALSLLALWQFVVFAKLDAAGERGRRKWIHLTIATGAFALALLAKPSAVVVPLMAVVLDWFFVRRGVSRTTIVAGFWLILAAPIAMIARHFQPARIVPDVAIFFRPLVALDAVGFYLRKLILPVNLAADYGRAPDRVMHSLDCYVTAGLAAAVILIAILLRRRMPWLLAGVALFVVGALPYLGLTKFDFQWFSTTADRYVYLSMVGPALVVAFAVARWPTRAVFIGLSVACAILACLSFRQAEVWRDTTSLFEHTLAINPRSLVAHNVLAYFDAMHQRPGEAEAHYREALVTRPDDPPANFNYGNVLAAQGRLQEAAEHYERTLAKTPQHARAMNNLGVTYARLRRFADAERVLRVAVVVDPANAEPWANLGQVLVDEGDLKGAESALMRAIQLDPNSRIARGGLLRMQAAATQEKQEKPR